MVKNRTSALFLILLLACADGTQLGYQTVAKNEAITLKVEADSVVPDSTIALRDWQLTDEVLAIHSLNADGMVQLWKWPELQHRHSFLRIGRGPDEFLAANWCACASKDRIALYDMPSRKMRSFLLRRDSLIPGRTYELIGRNPVEKTLLKPYVAILEINDSIFVLRSSDPHEDELSVADLSNGKILSRYEDILDRDPSEDQYLAYDYSLGTNGKYVVKAYEILDRVEILELTDDYALTPRWVIAGSHPSRSGRPVCYHAVRCEADWFACLFAGDSSAGSVLECYDYAGNQLDRIRLDRSLTHVVYAEKEGVFCGYDADSEGNCFYLFRYPAGRDSAEEAPASDERPADAKTS